MSGITQFDQPAQAKFMNTYVPLNMGMMMDALNKKQSGIQQGLAMLGQTENMIDNIVGIPGSPDDRYANETKAKVAKLVDEYADKDLSNVYVIKEFNTKLKGVADPGRLDSINRSYQNYLKFQQHKLAMGDKYNPLLDKDPASKWDSSKEGVYVGNPGWTPTYLPKEKTLDPYFDELWRVRRVLTEEGTDKFGRYKVGRNMNDLRNIVEKNAGEYASSVSGQQEIELYRKAHPEAADRSSIDIAKDIMYDYGRRYLAASGFTGVTNKNGSGLYTQTSGLTYSPGSKGPSTSVGEVTYKDQAKQIKQWRRELEDETDPIRKGILQNRIDGAQAVLDKADEAAGSIGTEKMGYKLNQLANVAVQSGLYDSPEEALKDIENLAESGQLERESTLGPTKADAYEWKDFLKKTFNFATKAVSYPVTSTIAAGKALNDWAAGDDANFKDNWSAINESGILNPAGEGPAKYNSKDEFLSHVAKTLIKGEVFSGVKSNKADRDKIVAANAENISTYRSLDLGTAKVGDQNFITLPGGKPVEKSAFSAYASDIQVHPENYPLYSDDVKQKDLPGILKSPDTTPYKANLIFDPHAIKGGTTTPKLEIVYKVKDGKKKNKFISVYADLIGQARSERIIPETMDAFSANNRTSDKYEFEATVFEGIPEKILSSEITEDKPLDINLNQDLIPYESPAGEQVPYTLRVVKAGGNNYVLEHGYIDSTGEHFEPIVFETEHGPVAASGSRDLVVDYALNIYKGMRDKVDQGRLAQQNQVGW